MSLRAGAILLGMLALAMLVLTGCDAMPGRPQPAERPVLPSEVTAFTALYARHCAGCHGADGRLGAARPLNDPIYLALVPPERLRNIIAQGVPGTAMPAFATNAGGVLSEAQIEVLVGDMLTRWSQLSTVEGVALPPYDVAGAAADGVSRGDPAPGLEVYATACAGCHGVDGGGGRKGFLG